MRRARRHDGAQKTCAGCGGIFAYTYDRNKSSYQFSKRIYCSDACRKETRLRQVTEGFWDLLDRTSATGCWEWTGKKNAKGYGMLSIRNRYVRTHRHAYELAKGPIEKGKMILHGCDNPCCCNPQHLRQGTAKENAADAIARGRFLRKSATSGNS